MASTWSAAESLLKGLDLRLQKETEVPVRLVRQPLESVVLGAGRAWWSPSRSSARCWMGWRGV